MLAAHDRAILDFIGKGNDPARAYRDRASGEVVGAMTGTAEALRAKADELDGIDPADLAEIEAPRFLSVPMATADHANGIRAALDRELIGEGLNPLARGLLIELALFMDEDGKGYREYASAARRWGVTEDAIGKALGRCAKAGLIEVSREAYRGHSTEWRLTKKLRSILRKVASEADLPSEKGRSQRRPSEQKVGPVSEKVGPMSVKVGPSADPAARGSEEEAAAAHEVSQSPKPEASASELTRDDLYRIALDEARSNPNVERPEAYARALVQKPDWRERQQRTAQGLPAVADPIEAKNEALTDHIATCPYNHRPDLPAVGYRHPETGEPAHRDDLEVEQFRCFSFQEAPRETQGTSDLTAIGETELVEALTQHE